MVADIWYPYMVIFVPKYISNLITEESASYCESLCQEFLQLDVLTAIEEHFPFHDVVVDESAACLVASCILLGRDGAL